jgi:hypothetical protein
MYDQAIVDDMLPVALEGFRPTRSMCNLTAAPPSRVTCSLCGKPGHTDQAHTMTVECAAQVVRELASVRRAACIAEEWVRILHDLVARDEERVRSERASLAYARARGARADRDEL